MSPTLGRVFHSYRRVSWRRIVVDSCVSVLVCTAQSESVSDGPSSFVGLTWLQGGKLRRIREELIFSSRSVSNVGREMQMCVGGKPGGVVDGVKVNDACSSSSCCKSEAFPASEAQANHDKRISIHVFLFQFLRTIGTVQKSFKLKGEHWYPAPVRIDSIYDSMVHVHRAGLIFGWPAIHSRQMQRSKRK